MKIILILMVKNESAILERCLKSVEGVVDAFCITDTGSTDDTVDKAKTFLQSHPGCLIECEWKNFGHNRTISFEGAQRYVRDVLQWHLKECYGLLLDADMMFIPNTLRSQTLTETGYTIVQCAGNLEYPNCRLVRMDYPWKCIGVTHEYWSGPTQAIPKEVCFIDDRNDGGCKSDKFERDARLLEQGLSEDPENVRYMFYLAQTYHSLGRFKDSIRMYKKRIAAGGWDEERWYSMYMIGQSYLSLGDPIRFEAWMLRAYAFRPGRAEPLYKLTKYFREKSQHFKAYQYALLGKQIPSSNDSLFIEKDVYTRLFDYELTILTYYVSPDREDGLRKSIDYLLKTNDSLVFSNMVFYMTPIGGGIPLGIDRNFFGPDFHPGSVCLFKNGMNVRFVNYRLDAKTRNTYEMCENGVYTTHHTVRTKNAFFQHGQLIAMNDDTVRLPKQGKHICGLEDIRVFEKDDGDLWFTATTLEYSKNIQILYGKYNPKGEFSECRVLESPSNQSCEKNWLGIPNTKDMIYNWFPLRIGSVEGNHLNIHTIHPTPVFFERMRGSASPVRFGDELWVMTHVVEYSVPRKYYHMFVALHPTTYAPIRMTLPFVFEDASVEYCLGMVLTENGIQCVYSSMDDNPKLTTIPFNRLQWISL